MSGEVLVTKTKERSVTMALKGPVVSDHWTNIAALCPPANELVVEPWGPPHTMSLPVHELPSSLAGEALYTSGMPCPNLACLWMYPSLSVFPR